MSRAPQPPPPPSVVPRARRLLETSAQRSRTTAHERVRRLRELGTTIAQTALAAAGAWLVASELFGHARPFFAPIAAVIVLGATRGRHAARAVELAAGVALGICVADVIVYSLGSSPLTIALVVALAMGAAIALGGEALFVSQAATSATLVATLPLPDHFTLARAADALAGGAVALAVGFLLLPIDPIRLVRTTARTLLDDLAAVLADLAAAVEARDRKAVINAVLRARDLDDGHARLADAASLGIEVATYSPLRRRRRGTLERYTLARATLGLQSTTNLSTSAIVGQVRSTALDLLRCLGDDRETAAAMVRAAARDAPPPR